MLQVFNYLTKQIISTCICIIQDVLNCTVCSVIILALTMNTNEHNLKVLLRNTISDVTVVVVVSAQTQTSVRSLASIVLGAELLFSAHARLSYMALHSVISEGDLCQGASRL